MGTAMGTRMTPSYPNLLMGHIEEAFLDSQHVKPPAWFRFINNIFMALKHGIENILSFLDHLNSLYSFKCTKYISDKVVTILDVD